MAATSRNRTGGRCGPGVQRLNVVVWGALLNVIWTRMIDRVPSTFWWVTYGAAVLFAPAISTIFWLQPNLIVFGLALGGFRAAWTAASGRGAAHRLSVAIKPIVVLLRSRFSSGRQTRVAGVWAIGTAAVLSFAGLGFLAWRAGDPLLLNRSTTSPAF